MIHRRSRDGSIPPFRIHALPPTLLTVDIQSTCNQREETHAKITQEILQTSEIHSDKQSMFCARTLHQDIGCLFPSIDAACLAELPQHFVRVAQDHNIVMAT